MLNEKRGTVPAQPPEEPRAPFPIRDVAAIAILSIATILLVIGTGFQFGWAAGMIAFGAIGVVIGILVGTSGSESSEGKG